MELFSQIRSRFPQIPSEPNFSFARHTTVGLGGRADCAVYPESAEEVAELFSFFAENEIPYVLLGAGANVLPADGPFCGAVVRFSRMRALFPVGEYLFAEAGVTGGRLCRFARERGIGGFEPFTGIPMSVGGAVVMNAGVREGHISDVVSTVIGVEKGRIRTFSLSECRFSEKASVFSAGIAVTGALFKAKKRSESEIEARTEYFRKKRAHLPAGRSMGCVFVNPEGGSAGALIEACGLKGFSVGGVRVSEKHANFMLNEGGTAEEYGRLIAIVKETVLRKTGILLREEIKRIPPESNTDDT